MLKEFLKNYRLKHNLSQKKMAELCGTAQCYYSQIETGVKKPGFTMISKLAKVIGCEESFLRSLL